MRDNAIVAWVEAGSTVAEVAAEFNVSARTARAVVERARRTTSPLDRSEMELVEALLRGSEAREYAFKVLAYEFVETAPSACVGALKAAGEEQRTRVSLLQALGRLPRDMSYFKTMSEVSILVVGLVDRLELLERGETTAREVADYARDILSGARPLVPDPEDGDQ